MRVVTILHSCLGLGEIGEVTVPPSLMITISPKRIQKVTFVLLKGEVALFATFDEGFELCAH